MTVVVTAAAGRTGRHLVRALRTAGLDVRATGRGEKVHQLAGEGVTTAQADLYDSDSLIEAFRGAEAVVHYNPGMSQRETTQGINAIDAAEAAGVRRFVFVSVYHPQIEFFPNHQAKARVEDYLVGTSMEYTILQPMHYIDNFDPRQIAEAGVFRLPYSMETRLAFITMGDLAEVAAKVLTEPGHVYATYPLCGPDILSGYELAEIIGRHARKDIATELMSIDDFLDFFSRFGEVGWYSADLLRRLCTYYDVHGITGNANVLRWVLGREPTTVADYVREALNGA